MRAAIPLLLALHVAFPAVSGLPYSAVQPALVDRQAPGRPKYSVVPLEPEDGNEPDETTGDDGGRKGGNGGGGSKGDKGNTGDGDDGDDSSDDGSNDDFVTVIETVTRTQGPVIITHTVQPEPITHTKVVPTTVVSVIDMEGSETTATVEPQPEPTKEPPAAVPTEDSSETVTSSTTEITTSTSEKTTTSTTTEIPEPTPIAPIDDSEPNFDVPHVDGAPQWQPEPPADHAPTTPTTLQTITTEAPAASTSTTTDYDNGQWHTTYPAWNETAWRENPAA